jgi:hypothetical protein
LFRRDEPAMKATFSFTLTVRSQPATCHSFSRLATCRSLAHSLPRVTHSLILCRVFTRPLSIGAGGDDRSIKHAYRLVRAVGEARRLEDSGVRQVMHHVDLPRCVRIYEPYHRTEPDKTIKVAPRVTQPCHVSLSHSVSRSKPCVALSSCHVSLCLVYII